MRKRLVALVVVALACKVAAASVGTDDFSILAAGDTLKVATFFRVTGSPDSVRWTFTARNATTRTVSLSGPANNIQLVAGPIALLPVPALAEGDTTTVGACPVSWKRGAAYPGTCVSRLFTRPIVPPTLTTDSVVVIPALWIGPWDTTVPFTVTAFLNDGTRRSVVKNVYTGLQPGMKYVVAFIQEEGAARVHTDTAWLDIRAQYPNQPAGFVAFASTGPMVVPPQVAGTPPGWLGKWSAVPSTNLTTVPDSAAGMRVQ